ncbi:multicopper oxidase family protein [Sediminimonas sp.]|uniref:multicopper oxidase family protein n=1 Tax=Sediminimonas sp. TaxID=2823379 RepID=UPI0025F1E11F|nr:multicopper oxidase family protein [Sediminimonas sp.]
MTTRRAFLGGTAASAACAVLPGAAAGGPLRATAQAAAMPSLVARETSVRLAPPDYPATGIWGYDATMPGPVVRLPQGGRVSRRLVNELPQATSVHWHGVRIDNAMDGVAGLTQDAVPPGGEFDIDFVAPDAGTYWYHAHNRSWEQVARGLYGALVVEEAEGPNIDRDEVLILDDWRLDPETAQLVPDFTAAHDQSHAGRLGNFIATNGTYGYTRDVRRHERMRLRLINAANARVFQLALAGLEGWIVALDGMPLEMPQLVSETMVLGPAQRVDLLVDVTAAPGEAAHLVRVGDGQGYSQAAFNVTGEAAVARRGAPQPLPPNRGTAARPDLAAARRVRLVMSGGAMGRMQSAVLDGERRGFRDLAAAGKFWSFNDTVGMTETPLAELSRGEPVRLEIVNDTVFPHAMHLHGMHFREVRDGTAAGPMRDTAMILAGETREIAFTADNPGDWLFHCHMLSHAASGMMTWMRVA